VKKAIKTIQWKENVEWPALITGVVSLCLSLVFKAWDMAAVSIFGILGVVVLFIYSCYLDIKYEREFDAYTEFLQKESARRRERLCRYLDTLDEQDRMKVEQGRHIDTNTGADGLDLRGGYSLDCGNAMIKEE